jgi:hypothetical protein
MNLGSLQVRKFVSKVMKWFGRPLTAKPAGLDGAACFLGKVTYIGVSLNDVDITTSSVAFVQRYRKTAYDSHLK